MSDNEGCLGVLGGIVVGMVFGTLIASAVYHDASTAGGCLRDRINEHREALGMEPLPEDACPFCYVETGGDS